MLLTQILNGKQQFLDGNGDPLGAGQVFMYVPNTTTFKNTYSDYQGLSLNPNPIVLDSSGEAIIFGSGAYRQVVKDVLGNTIWDTITFGTGNAGSVLFTDLPTLTPAVGSAVFIYGSGGRNGVFIWNPANLSSQVASDPLQGLYVAPSLDPTGASGAWQRYYDTYANVLWWGADASGASDSTAATNAAITAIGHGVLFFPSGTFKFSGPITINGNGVTLLGSGAIATVLQTTSTTANLIEIGNGTANPNNIVIEGFTMNSAVTRTNGAYVQVKNGHDIKINSLRLDAGFNGILLLGGSGQYIYMLNDLEINNSVNDGIRIGDATGLVQDVFLSDMEIAASGNNGISLFNAGGVYGSNVSIINCFVGILAFPGTGEFVNGVFMNNCLGDTCVSSGWKFLENGGYVSNVTLTGCWGSSNGTGGTGHGFETQNSTGKVSSISFSGCIAINNKQNGFALLGGDHLFLGNCTAESNSTAGSGLKHGVEIGANVSNWNITGGNFGSGGQFVTNLQGYGILINTGTSDNFSIIGAGVNGNVTGGIADGSTGTHKYIYGNPGFTTSASGAGTLATGNSSITINHGLSVTPAKEQFTITPVSSMSAAGINSLWVSAVTTTTFTVTSNVNVTQNFFFGWGVRTEGA